MKRFSIIWRSLLVASVVASGSATRAQNDVSVALKGALDALDNDHSREAVALLADAARRHPQDRKLGSLLYALLRDRSWPVPQTLPVRMSAAITAAEFSMDGSLVIAGTEDGTVRIFDVERAEFTPVIVQHTAPIAIVKFSPDHELALSVGRMGAARVWEVKTGNVLRKWSLEGRTFTAAAAATDDLGLIALGYDNGEVHIYSRTTGEALGDSIKHAKAVTDLVFSGDGKALATASADGTTRVWDVATMKARGFVVRHDAPLTNVDIGPLGTLLLTSSEDGIAKISEATNGAPILSSVDCGAGIRDAGFSPSGLRFHTVLTDHTVRIWDSFTGEPVEGVIRAEDGITHANWGPAGIRLACSPWISPAAGS